jgi:hypothetical protein
MNKPKYIPKGCFWAEKAKKLYMEYCPKCERENYAPAATSGICAWCHWDVNKNKYYKEEKMKKLNRSQELIKEFPDLFPIGFQITSGDGWLELIRLVCNYFKQLLDRKDVDYIKFAQIKEKFGLLRIYFDAQFGKKKITNPLFEQIHSFIYTIENVSNLVCEDCGKIKNKNFNVETRTPRNFWKRTLCDKCFEKDHKGYENGKPVKTK